MCLHNFVRNHIHELSAGYEQKKLRSSGKASKMRLLRIEGAAERQRALLNDKRMTT